MDIRLQKILARAGYGSRRGCEEIIASGRVQVNQKVAELGDKADPDQDQIEVDGQPIADPEQPRYVALHKPSGVLSTVKTPGSRSTVRDYVPIPGRLYPVGRLDYDSEGLILMTNDGKLTNRLTHPRYEHEKEYRVLVSEKPDASQIKTLQQGVKLKQGQKTLPARVWIDEITSQGVWLGFILKEGKKRQIRRMTAAVGLTVQRLVRTRIAALELGDLQPGEWRHLQTGEIEALKTT